MRRETGARAWHSARAFGLAALLLSACLFLVPTAARADLTFSLNNGAVGGVYGLSPTTNVFSGALVTGTVTIDPTAGALTNLDLHVQGDPSVFNGFFCLSNCTYFYNGGFTEYGLLDLRNLVGFRSGALAPDSWIYLAGEQYYLSGSLPEPGLYGTLAIGLGGMLLAGYRRRRAQHP